MDRNWFAKLRARQGKKLADRLEKANAEIAASLHQRREGLLKLMKVLDTTIDLEIKTHGVVSAESIAEMASIGQEAREFMDALASNDEFVARAVVTLCAEGEGGK
jgi:hypothetical protein